ncbi:MAG: ABC transporter ATP-binding protein [Gammaproteobacteria bacterium]|nr:ABC transporter ATP-binding protein [Gammaproteobacteria bacterium]
MAFLDTLRADGKSLKDILLKATHLHRGANANTTESLSPAIDDFRQRELPLLSLRDVQKSHSVGPIETTVLNEVNLDVHAGDLLSIMGQSGSGKSTLLNIMGLLDRPTSGTLNVIGRDVADMNDDELSDTRNLSIGFVFQSFHLLPRLSACDNVAVPLAYRGFEAGYARECAEAMLEKVGIADRSDHRPDQLSGGQQQRVSIARALVSMPAILLADEPTGALDPNTGKEIMQLFVDLNSDDGTTVVIITHDPGVARRCERNVRLVNGTITELDGSNASAHNAGKPAA